MEGLGSFLLFALFFYLMMRFGCGAHMVHGSHTHSHSQPNHADPVCGMHVEPDKGYGKIYESQLYRFCSKNCLDKFDDNPEQYLNLKEEDKEVL
ncbi:MAG: YHS domain-containing protein [Gammaproteobacteria bacterium]